MSMKGRTTQDLKGRRFGRLIVLRCADDDVGIWLCKCDCGAVCRKKSSLLLTGRNTHCGRRCILKQAELKPITGKTYGQLTVLSKEKRRHPTLGKALYLCQCSCGRYAYVVKSNLVTGNTQSCGCLRSKRFAEYLEKRRNVSQSGNFINSP